jgi:hypothetical protein
MVTALMFISFARAGAIPDADGDGFELPDDCNDSEASINPDAIERCDEIDNNCNGAIDEATLTLTPELSPSCEWHTIDTDGDGWGLPASEVRLGSSDRYCLCPAFETLDVTPEGDIVPVAAPNVCEHWTDLGGTPKLTYGHIIGGYCYVKNEADCDNADTSFRVTAPGEARAELLDGHDNDCDGFIPAIELDCDDDGGLPLLPTMSAELTARPAETAVMSAAEVGLATCGGAAPALSCWGEDLSLTCDAQTGLWVASVAAVQALGKMNGPRGVDAGSCTDWDCDDQCPARCGGLGEVCDGLDNDCNDNASLLEPDTDGLPEALSATGAPGYIDPSERDANGDGFAECTIDQGLPDQVEITDQACAALEPTVPVGIDVVDDVDTAADACGCDHGGASRGLGLLALGLLLRRRR